LKEDDNNWPEPDRVGKQELEIVLGNEHISFATSKIGSLVDCQSSNDPEGLRIFYYLVQVSSLFLPPLALPSFLLPNPLTLLDSIIYLGLCLLTYSLSQTLTFRVWLLTLIPYMVL